MRRAALAALALLAACQAEDDRFVRARQITALDQAIGGPTAYARVGDFLLENDQIRAVVEQGGISYLPTDVGGSLIDVDLNRPQGEFRGGRGLDQLGEIVPIANLNLAKAEATTHVRITGSRDGVEVTTATEAQPAFRILLALVVLIDRRFAEGPLAANLYNEYELRPGERLVRIRTTVGFNVPFCPVTPEDGCNPECDDALYDDDCECPQVPARCQAAVVRDAAPMPDRPLSTLLDILLGDLPRPFGSGTCVDDNDCDVNAGETCVEVTQPIGGDLNVCRTAESRDAGMLLGDLLVFGAQLSPFVKGIGYDTETDVRRLFDLGKDTLSQPLEVDAVYATGDRVSIGYESPAGRILVPIFSGPFSLGATHAATCATSEPLCLEGALVRFERRISVGEGDIASAQAPLDEAAGRPTGLVRGVVTEEPSGDTRSHVDVYALRHPRGLPCTGECAERCGDVAGDARDWTLEQLRTHNRCRTSSRQFSEGHSAIESFAKTDVGTDPQLDGRFAMRLPPGEYVLVAFDGHKARSGLVPIAVAAGGTVETHLELPESSALDYAIFDETAQPGPGKITVGRLPGDACATDDDCSNREECLAGACNTRWETLLPLEFGGRRPVDGILWSEHSASGRGHIELPPGDYEVLFSRGPHYSIDRQEVTLQPRLTGRAEGYVRRVVDRQGWIAAGLHVHSANSIDADEPTDDRVTSFLVEDMDLLASSDHDWITDYDPLVRKAKATDRLDTMVGIEVTTQEYGHYIAFPVRHRWWEDGNRLPSNGALQWRGLPPPELIAGARELAGDLPVLIDIPHPYDYFDLYQVDPVTLEPQNSLLVVLNPMLDPSWFTGDFELMELANTKNFHRMRRATVSEVADYGRALDALIDEREAGDIDQATFDRRWFELAAESTRRRLHRTVAEQEAALAGEGNEVPCLCSGDRECASGRICEPSTMTCAPAPGSDAPAPPADALCRRSRGAIDDWFSMLNRGMVRTGVAGSDEHGREAGFMRTMVRTDGTTPPFIEPADIVDALRAGHAMVTNAPMVHFSIDGAGVGDMLTANDGAEVTLSLRVEKAPWYDVDRIEIYRNGHLIHWANGCGRARGNDDDDEDSLPCIETGDAVLAWDQTIADTPDRDAWYVVLVYGLDGRSLAPVYESETLAEIGTPQIMQALFTVIPGLQEFTYPRTPSIFPVFPFAFTNPIFVDLGGNGWDPPDAPPSWCREGDFGC